MSFRNFQQNTAEFLLKQNYIAVVNCGYTVNYIRTR